MSVPRIDVDLARLLDPIRYQQAARTCQARVILLPRGLVADWPLPEQPDAGFQGLLVVRGMLSERIAAGRRKVAELRGPGDVLRPWPLETDEFGSAGILWRAHEPTALAILDRHYHGRAAPWPELDSALRDRENARAHSLLVRLLIVQVPRVKERVHLVLWHLAARWGRVRPDGVSLPLRLSNALLAELISSTRESVSRALSSLNSDGRVAPIKRGFLLRGGEPGTGATTAATQKSISRTEA